jgi:hypothetical protein
MRNTINANQLEEIVNLAKNPKAWQAKYGNLRLRDVLEAKTGKGIDDQQNMAKLPPRQLRSQDEILESKYGKPTIVNGKKLWRV